MAISDVLVPDIGDLDKVDVVEVLVAAGDRVSKDESLITLESDKATMDVPSPLSGRVQEVKVKAGDSVGEGHLILTLETEGADQSVAALEEASLQEERPAPVAEEAVRGPAAAPQEAPEETGAPPSVMPAEEVLAAMDSSPGEGDPTPGPTTPPPRPETMDFSKAYASPAIRRFARLLGVDLARVQGSGRKSRILKEDVQGFVKKTIAEPSARAGLALPEVPLIDFSKFGEVESQKLSRVQRISGPNLQRSWLNAPHVTQHDEADVTDLEAFRQLHKERAKKQGFNLTPLAFVMKAAVAALQEFPRLNSSLEADGESVTLKNYYHLGIAVDTGDGLIVPVFRDVDKKGIFALAQELAEVSAQARERKLKPDQLRGASFTISSLGGIGGTFFTPIINVPEVAILGVSRSQVKPAWKDGEFVPRLILPLSLSYDHRVIDGAMAVRFTTYLAEVLSDIRRLVL